MDEVHFCHRDDELVQRKIPYQDGDNLVVDIPDEQFQVGKNLIVYGVTIHEDEDKLTFKKQIFAIEPREKPPDYIYTPAEKETWQSLDERLKRMEDGGGSGLTAGHGIIISKGVVSVQTANLVEEDNTLPVSSAAVHVVCGNIEALLGAI